MLTKNETRAIPHPIEKLITVVETPGVANPYTQRPHFRFGGRYLEKFGFMLGTKVKLFVEPGKITLTIEDCPPKSEWDWAQ